MHAHTVEFKIHTHTLNFFMLYTASPITLVLCVIIMPFPPGKQAPSIRLVWKPISVNKRQNSWKLKIKNSHASQTYEILSQNYNKLNQNYEITIKCWVA